MLAESVELFDVGVVEFILDFFVVEFDDGFFHPLFILHNEVVDVVPHSEIRVDFLQQSVQPGEVGNLLFEETLPVVDVL